MPTVNMASGVLRAAMELTTLEAMPGSFSPVKKKNNPMMIAIMNGAVITFLKDNPLLSPVMMATP